MIARTMTAGDLRVLGGVVIGVMIAFVGCRGEVKSGQGTAPSAGAPGGTATDARAASTGGRPGSGGVAVGTGVGATTGGNATTGGSGGGVDASLNETGGARDAGPAPALPPEQDAGPTPPPYCVAPCVWEVVKHCIPELRSCWQTPAFSGYASVTCDPETGWSEYSGLVASKTWKFSVSYRGVECFRWNSGGIPGLSVSSLVDRLGNVVAAQVAGEPLYCGVTIPDIFAAHMAQKITDAGFELDGGFVPAYHLDRSRPECAAWDDHGLPVRPPCEVTDGGVCP